MGTRLAHLLVVLYVYYKETAKKGTVILLEQHKDQVLLHPGCWVSDVTGHQHI